MTPRPGGGNDLIAAVGLALILFAVGVACGWWQWWAYPAG